MPLIYTQQITAITANGTLTPRITPTAGKLVYSIMLACKYAGGTNTIAGFCAVLTKIIVKAGTKTFWELSSTQLRDHLLKHGTTYDFNGTPNDLTGVLITLPFAPDYLLDYVADSLALNPAILGGPIIVELTSSAALTVTAYEMIADDLSQPSNGFISLEVVSPVVGGLASVIEEPFELRGDLVSLAIYPESGSGSAYEPTPVSVQVGTDNRFVHQALSSAENDETLERKNLTPAASGRTAKIYDVVFVKGDALQRAVPLERVGKIKVKIEAASSMSGTSSILVERIERKLV